MNIANVSDAIMIDSTLKVITFSISKFYYAFADWICPIGDCLKINEENVITCSKCGIERQFSKPEKTIEQSSSLWSRFMSIFGRNEVQQPNIPVNDSYDKGLQKAYQYLTLKVSFLTLYLSSRMVIWIQELKDHSIVNFEKPLIPREMICKHFDALSDDGTQIEDDGKIQYENYDIHSLHLGLQYGLITEVLEAFCNHDYFSKRIFQCEFPRILNERKILCEIR